MKWNNAQKDKLPTNGQRVLISVEGIYYIGNYQDKNRTFAVNNTAKTTFLIDDCLIYWTEF